MIRRTLCGLGLLLLLSGGFVLAQMTTGTISGTVRDASGAVIPGVEIALRNLDTGSDRALMTDAQGRYQALSLPLGNYEIQARKSGFQSEIRRGVAMTVGREAIVNFDLQVGAVAQTVEVTGEAPLVETTGSSVSGLVESAQIESLPLNGRNYHELATLQPGVILPRTQINTFQNGMSLKLSIRGARHDQNSFLLDGTDVSGPTNEIPGSVGGQSLGVDAVREFRVETGVFSAQYGRAAGGVINVITKSGTNEFHGTAFEFLRNDNLDAREFFDDEKPEFTRHQFGFSAGGPIRKDRMFFFGNYEGLQERLGQTLIAVVPNAAARQGRLPNVAPFTVSPAVVPYLNLFPLPNTTVDFGDGTARYIDSHKQPTTENYFVARQDWNVSSSDSFFARYTFDQGTLEQPGSYSLVLDGTRNRNQFVTLGETHIFTPRLLNSIRFGFNRSHRSIQALTPGFEDQLLEDLAYLPGHPLFKTGSTLAPGGGVSAIGNTNIPRIWAWNLFEGSNDLTFATGAHTLKGGALFKRMQFNIEGSLTAGGQYSFGSLENFLKGLPSSIRVLDPFAPGQAQGARYNYLGWYIQDDYRVSPRLTLNLGFRHEFYTNPTEVAGRICNLDTIYGEGGTAAAPTGNFRCSNPMWAEYYRGYKNFGPKFGFAWDVFGSGKTALRGGYGIFYDAMAPISWYSSISTMPPASKLLAPANPAGCLGGTQTANCLPFPHPYEFLVSGAGAAGLSPSPIGFTGTPNTMQYTLTMQQQLSSDAVMSLGYVGSLGRHLLFRAQKNIKEPTILPDGRKCFNFLVGTGANARTNPSCPNGALTLRNPNLGGRVNFHLTEANSTYNSLILSLQKRMSQGLQWQVSYTYSKSLDIGPSLANGATTNFSTTQGILDPDDWKKDRSRSDFDLRNSLTVNSTWDIPVGQGRLWGTNLRGVAEALLGGWQLSGILRVSSGPPFTVGTAQRNWSMSGASQPAERPDLAPGASQNPITGTSAGCTLPVINAAGQISGPLTTTGGRVLGTPELWFDPCSFRAPELGFYGTLGRNTVTAPHANTVDLSLLKTFNLRPGAERWKVQFRGEMFNIFNHANFGVPALEVIDNQGRIIGNAGRIDSTTGTSRQIQFGLKLSW